MLITEEVSAQLFYTALDVQMVMKDNTQIIPSPEEMLM